MTTGSNTSDIWAAVDKLPLSPPPSGVTPNFEHPTWHGQPIIVAASVCVPIVLFFSAVRIYTKCYVPRKWKIDDSIFIVSLFAGLLYISLAVAMITDSIYGYHVWDSRIGNLKKTMLVRMIIFLVLSGPLNWAVKLAVFSFIYSALRPLLYIRVMIYIVVILAGFYSIGVAIVYGVFCGPKGGQDRPAYMAGFNRPQCKDPAGLIETFSVISGAVTLGVDLFLFILPLPAVLRLKVDRKKKAGVFLIFLTAIGGCLIGPLVIYYRGRRNGHNGLVWNYDFVYKIIPLVTSRIVEFSVGIIIPCMAAFATFTKRVWSSVSLSTNSFFSSFRHSSTAEEIPAGTSNINMVSRQPRREFALDTIDRMLEQIPFKERRTEGDGYHAM